MINKLKSDFEIKKYDIRVRFVNKSDASFILALRTDPQLGRFISETSSEIGQQIKWLENYKLREKEGKEYYFIYYYKEEPMGVNRIYNINFEKKEAVGGSFVFKKRCLLELPVLATLIQLDIAFNLLGIDKILGDIRKGNQKVVKFHKILKVHFTGEDEQNLYYEYDRDTFNKTKAKLEALLLPINEK